GTIPGHAANMPTPETVGQAFVNFCFRNEHNPFQMPPEFGDFLAELKKRYPSAGIDGKPNKVEFDDGDVQVWKFTAGPADSATEGWLLPAAKSLNEFHLLGENGKVFHIVGNPTPATLMQVVPALISRSPSGGAWTVRMEGLVAAGKSQDLITFLL